MSRSRMRSSWSLDAVALCCLAAGLALMGLGPAAAIDAPSGPRIRLFAPGVFAFDFSPSSSNREQTLLAQTDIYDGLTAAPAGAGSDTQASVVRNCIVIDATATPTAPMRICLDPGSGSTLAISIPGTTDIFGLGADFASAGGLNLSGRIPSDPEALGNRLVSFEGGSVAAGQFPLAFALGGARTIALIVDNASAQTWRTEGGDWTISSPRGPIRGIAVVGPDLAHVRRSVMSLIGHPPVPPRAAFGLWLSEYGYRSWNDVDDHLATLRAKGFPVSGFMLDMYWFGGIGTDGHGSRMGTLDWDLAAFPDPARHVALLKQQGIGLMPIEEPYVATTAIDRTTGRPILPMLGRRGFLARSGAALSAAPSVLPPAWWGQGALLDFTNPDAAAFWHRWKRHPLVDTGVAGHWTDLGEPEQFDPAARYGRQGLTHAEVHNVFGLLWAKSIAEGYRSSGSRKRPFILARSGMLGIQRWGAALWSGDIAANFESLRAQLTVQAQISLSGIDYFGSDVGGFVRSKPDTQLGDLYTQWFADSSLFDVPVRPHSNNLCKCRQTAPDRIGDGPSNLASIRLRYELLPYYYSSAHLAWEDGDPLISPLALYFQADDTARSLVMQKMIGRDLMGVAVAREKASAVDVYLPAGTWFPFRGGPAIESAGSWLRDVGVRGGGLLTLPIYARAGAIIPMARVLANGRSDGQNVDVMVFPSSAPSSRELIEDDGETIGYRDGLLRRTRLSQVLRPDRVEIAIDAGRGTYAAAPAARLWTVTAPLPRSVESVRVNGLPLPRHNGPSSSGDAGWYESNGRVSVELGLRSEDERALVELDLSPG